VAKDDEMPPEEQKKRQPGEQKRYTDILTEQIEHGLGEIQRPAGGLLSSGFSAGLDIGLGVLVMAVLLTLTSGELPEPIVEMLVASAYALGFIFVILGRSELFTEHTTLAAFPVLAGRASLGALGRLWGLVYVANLVGAAFTALLVVIVGTELGVAEGPAFGRLATGLVETRWWVMLLSALLAGWLMGLLSWLVAAAEDSISRIVIVWLVTGAIGLAHLHHCIIGTVEVVSGIIATGEVTVGQFGRFLLLSSLGNATGGAVFVAAVKFRHSTRPAPERTN